MPWIAQCPPGCGDGGKKSRSTYRNAATSYSNSGRFLDVPQPYGQGTLCRLYTSAGWTSPFVSQAPTGICKSTFIYLRPSSDPSLTQGAGYLKTLLFKNIWCIAVVVVVIIIILIWQRKKNPGKTIYYCFWKPIIWGICDHTEFLVVSDIQLPPCLRVSPPYHILSGKYLSEGKILKREQWKYSKSHQAVCIWTSQCWAWHSWYEYAGRIWMALFVPT